MDNPFVTKGYAGAEYFCDRVAETDKMVELLVNGNNMALISPRRVGKTDLIYHCFNQQAIKERFYTFHIDIYSTRNVRDFVNVFGRAILDELKPRGRKAWEAFVNAIRSLHSEISFDINNNPIWSIGLGDIDNPAVTLDEIFSYLAQADRPCLVAIDEFQQIAYYQDVSNVEALMRTYVQKCHNATFIFAGSKRHLMAEIFISPARPFYQSVMIMNLAPISEEKYVEFAQQQFAKYGKRIESDAVRKVYHRFDAVTSCMQRVLNVMFMQTPEGETCTGEGVEKAIDYIIGMFSEAFTILIDTMPQKQREVFVAIAKEGTAEAVTGRNFLKRHHLQTASVVTAALRGLLDKDFITQDKNRYTVYDPFFALWIRERY